MLSTLFVDFNSFFASVEQQLRPELRGKPVAVVPLLSDSTCCIAASYPAKAFGVKTGTNVGQARKMCPTLHIVEARPDRYVEFHHRLIAAVDTCIPVETVFSVDEMSCRLLGAEREEAHALDIAHRIKRAIRERVGECLTCSIGIAPNRFLAKLATDMQKPDGLVVIRREELPHRLHALQLTDLPGIARRMEKQLHSRGVDSVERLCALTEAEMVHAFHSITGRMWYHWLRGDDVEDQPTLRRSIGHQHVLAPSLRTDAGAYAVAVRLLHKAAARARRLEYWAGRITLSIRHADRTSWWQWRRLNCTQDTLEMIEVLSSLWHQRPPHTPMCVAVTLDHLTADRQVTLPLFAESLRRVQLCKAIDRLNHKYQRNVVYACSMHEGRHSAPMRIPFANVPDPKHDL